jgi:chaperonin GroES
MKKESKIIPLGDRVLVKPMSPEDAKKTKSGIIIPETVDRERPEQGKVIAVGEGRTNDDGKIIPMKVKVGDIVIFSKYGPDEVKVEGDEYFMLKEENILAVIK